MPKIFIFINIDFFNFDFKLFEIYSKNNFIESKITYYLLVSVHIVDYNYS